MLDHVFGFSLPAPILEGPSPRGEAVPPKPQRLAPSSQKSAPILQGLLDPSFENPSPNLERLGSTPGGPRLFLDPTLPAPEGLLFLPEESGLLPELLS